MWLALALLGYTILAVVAVMDKFILSKSVKPVIFTFYSSIFVLPIFLLVPFGVSFPHVWTDWIIFLISGFFFGLGLWAMFIGYQKSEISHVGPLVGAATPFFVLFLSGIFLKEHLNSYQLAAIFVLILGSLLVSFEKSEQHNGMHAGMLWGVFSGLLFAVSHVAAKYAYDAYGFYSGFVWTRGFLGVFGILLFLSPAVRKLFTGGKKNADANKEKSNVFLVATDKILGVAGLVLVQYAIAIGSVILVNALAGVQYAVLIILVALISKFLPKIIKEQYTTNEIMLESAGVFLIAAGLALMLLS